MKKICIKVYTAILLFIIILNNNISYAENFGRMISFDNDKIMVFQQLDSMRVKASKGHLLSSLEARTGIESVISEETSGGNVDICLILDCSSSMLEPLKKEERENYHKKIKESLEKKIKEYIELHGSSPDNMTIGRFQGEIQLMAIRELFDNNIQLKIKEIRERVSEFADQIANKFNSKARLSIISYSDEANLLFGLTPCTDENIGKIKNKIGELTTAGETYTGNAINKANTDIWQKDNEQNAKYTILLTDGFATDYEKVPNAIKQIKNKCDKFITVFMYEEDETKLEEYKDYYSNSDQSKFIDAEDLANTIEEIYESIATISTITHELKTETIVGYNAKMGDDNNVFSEIDTELINGATLEMEYSFNIISTEEIDAVTIIDHLKNDENPENILGFDEKATMLTNQNINNEDYWWRRSEKDNDIQTSFTIKSLKKDEDGKYNIVVKLLLNKVLAIESEIDKLTNAADITIKTKNGKTFLTKEATLDGTGENGKIIEIKGQLLPPAFTITPPMGNKVGILETGLIVSLIILIGATQKKYSKKSKEDRAV